MALELMVWFNAVSLILWPSSFTLPNILRAAGDAAFTMTVSVISMWVFRVAFCYLMVLKFTAACCSSGWACSWIGPCARCSSASALSAAGGWNKR